MEIFDKYKECFLNVSNKLYGLILKNLTLYCLIFFLDNFYNIVLFYFIYFQSWAN